MSKTTAIILAGGRGQRFTNDFPKQFVKLAGKSILAHSINAFLIHPDINDIIVVGPKGFIEKIETIVADLNPQKTVIVVAGGKTRQESSYCGLKACSPETDFVLLHDAVRPMISQLLISRVIESVKKYHAVDTIIETADTIVKVKNNYISSIPDRSKLKRGQTPQAFDYKLILKAHEWALENKLSNYTDDCGLIISKGGKVYCLHGDNKNVKVTHVDDLYLVERLFQIGKIPKIEDISGSNLKDKRTLVIGGSGGIGKSIVKKLNQHGAEVIVCSRKSELYIDVTDERSVISLFSSFHRKFDILIYSAGYLIRKRILEMSSVEWDQIYNTNLRGVFFVLKHIEKVLKLQGKCIFIGSSSYSLGRQYYAAYSSSKAALINLIQAAAAEMSYYYINVISPQRADTGMRIQNFPSKKDLTSLLKPEDIAEDVLKILSLNVSGMNFDIRIDVPLTGFTT